MANLPPDAGQPEQPYPRPQAPYGQPQGPYGPPLPSQSAPPAAQPAPQQQTPPPPPPPPAQPVAPPYLQAPQPPADASARKGLAITALILGSAAIVACWLPFLGILLALIGIIIGIVAVAKKQPKGLGLTGLILSIVAVIVGIITTIVAAFAFFTIGTAVPDLESLFEEMSGSQSQDGGPGSVRVTGGFPEVSASQLAQIADDPAAYTGTQLTLYGVVEHFVPYQPGYGENCGMGILVGSTPMTNTDAYEHYMLAYSGDWNTNCPVFDPLHPGDNVQFSAVVLGVETYTDMDNRPNSAPQLEIIAAEILR